MRSITLYVRSGYVNADHEETIEVSDDITDEELDEMAQDFMNNYIYYGWYDDNEDSEE